MTSSVLLLGALFLSAPLGPPAAVAAPASGVPAGTPPGQVTPDNLGGRNWGDMRLSRLGGWGRNWATGEPGSGGAMRSGAWG